MQALIIAQHAAVDRQTLPLAQPFITEEEEGLVFKNGATQRPAELVALEGRLPAAFTIGIRIRASVEEVAGVARLLGGAAFAQASYPCANDLPNPYRLVENWAQMPRRFAPVNAVTVDANNNFWAADRCEEAGCKSIFEIGPDGKTLKNFGADLFVEPHAMAVDKEGNVWVADASAKGAKGVQVTSSRPTAACF